MLVWSNHLKKPSGLCTPRFKMKSARLHPIRVSFSCCHLCPAEAKSAPVRSVASVRRFARIPRSFERIISNMPLEPSSDMNSPDFKCHSSAFFTACSDVLPFESCSIGGNAFKKASSATASGMFANSRSILFQSLIQRLYGFLKRGLKADRSVKAEITFASEIFKSAG